MHEKAFAPEYQGSLRELSVNTDYADVLVAAREREESAAGQEDQVELALARLAVAESCRRLGRLDEAEAAWRGSYASAERVCDRAAMAWALWSGGTLARQRGQLSEALRLLEQGRDLAELAGDETAYGYTFAGIAETLRIRGDNAKARELHEYVLAVAERRAEARHIVWALEGIAQIDRNMGDLDSAARLFERASETARDSGDERGYAWALRGVADVLSLQGDSAEALTLLARAEQICREMNLTSALAYNRKMRGNVLFRASWFSEAARTYRGARELFSKAGDSRGEALAQLGLLKSLDRLGRPREETRRDLIVLRDSTDGAELRFTHEQVLATLESLSD